ncbi:MAG: nicotinate-nucleotide diphosphorylase (carboxylating), partial [Clostridia bacterium]|nr:nicotinate-nucleotide diphosphorylase (carboxylating) [Clostridia bacterium]
MVDLFSLNKLIKTALEEDLGMGDITTNSTVPRGKRISGNFIAKAPGVLCGMDIAKAVFAYIDEGITLTSIFEDGQSVAAGDIIATIEGNAANVLIGERL